MERRGRLYLLIAAAALFALAAQARVFMTQQQALASAFPAGTKVERKAFFPTAEQLVAAKKESGVEFDDKMIVRYAGVKDGRVAGYAYFDTHRVRTLPETIMVVVTPEGRVDKVEILSFDEPADYFPRPRWFDQFRGKKLDSDLSLRGAIHPISGASLTARAIVNASRKILALHHVLGAQ
jgi:hypothetical protein